MRGIKTNSVCSSNYDYSASEFGDAMGNTQGASATGKSRPPHSAYANFLYSPYSERFAWENESAVPAPLKIRKSAPQVAEKNDSASEKETDSEEKTDPGVGEGELFLTEVFLDNADANKPFKYVKDFLKPLPSLVGSLPLNTLPPLSLIDTFETSGPPEGSKKLRGGRRRSRLGVVHSAAPERPYEDMVSDTEEMCEEISAAVKKSDKEGCEDVARGISQFPRPVAPKGLVDATFQRWSFN